MGEARPNPAWGDGPYSIKRHGVGITTCDSEPVQTPGCVQAHGALLVLRPDDLVIVQASENTAELLGLPPADLLGRSLARAIGTDGEVQVEAVLRRELVERNPFYVLTRPAMGALPALDVTVHTVGGVVVVELEPDPMPGAAQPDYYQQVKQSLARLRPTDSLAGFCQASAEEVRALTGFDRVMVYRFHDDGSGEVFAESRLDTLPSWLGLRYPAADIPKPAREVFEKIWVRPLPDVSGELAELVPLVHPETGRPLEMTWCSLRGASVMYTEYLHNMKVTAGLTLSIRRGGQLWGLIACHHYAGRRPVPHQLRTACELVAQVISLLHQAVDDREHFEYRLSLDAVHEQLVARAAGAGVGLRSLLEGSPDLLGGIAAGGVAVLESNRWFRLGVTPSEPELHALAEWIGARPELASPARPIFASDALPREYPPAAAFADVASGVLAISQLRPARDMILWFRPETVRDVHWAGNPHDKPKVLGPHGERLTPRASFELWRESVRERAVVWTPVEVEAALRLRGLLERRALEDELREADREKDEFIATLAHELRNPLAPISTGLQVLRAAPADSAMSARAREIMERQLAHLVRLIDDLLDVSRISRGRIELRRASIDVDAVIAHAVEASRPLIEGGGHTLTVARIGPPLCVFGDLTRLAQVIGNLLNNAAKYTPRGGSIEVESAFEDGQVVLRVRDSGIGMTADMLPTIFHLFAQEARSLDKAQGGLGIGLSLAHKLVTLHGGSITAESAGLGCGSTFTVRLPPAVAEPPPIGGGEEGARPAELPPRRILVVDDNVDGAESLATMLELGGHHTRTVHDGPSALDAVKEFSPEVVFLDIGMPGMDGHEVARRVRADPSSAGTVLVALTGWGAEVDQRRSREAGFDLHLTKPVGADEVWAVLAGL